MTVIWAEKALLESGWAEKPYGSKPGLMAIGSTNRATAPEGHRTGSCCPHQPIATATRFSAPWRG
jgi:hypothetical protein